MNIGNMNGKSTTSINCRSDVVESTLLSKFCDTRVDNLLIICFPLISTSENVDDRTSSHMSDIPRHKAVWLLVLVYKINVCEKLHTIVN